MNFTGNTSFVYNIVKGKGGGFYAKDSHILFIGYSSFIHNSADYIGGGVCVYNSIIIHLLEPTVFSSQKQSMVVESIHTIVLSVLLETVLSCTL